MLLRKKNSETKTILHFHDVMIRQHDFDTLADNVWLNDTIIEFHMEYLERIACTSNAHILLLRPGIVQLILHLQDPTYLASALPPHLDRYRYIFIPVNDSQPQAGYSGSHWSLLVFCRPNLTFYYYDTLHGTNQHVARLTAGRMVPLLRLTRQTIFKPVPTPQQDNGADCGVYVIAITDNLVQRLMSTLGHQNVNLERLFYVTAGDLPPMRKVRKELRKRIEKLSKDAQKQA
ncbi:hypothetical protein VTP01DRAFT_10833 [Rhizomucor pusillus]|uniref:uncharacterized protein n=1 Tax=Rhizomucor pusillus TaxID=4840 RepID=UPI0037447F82